MNERDLFIEALQQSHPARRLAYLDWACAGDAGLRWRVGLLLEADYEASEILKEAAPADTAIPELEWSWPTSATEVSPSVDSPRTLPFVERH